MAQNSNRQTPPKGFEPSVLQEMFRTGQTYYKRAFDRIRLLDAAAKGRMWEALRAKFPSYQILPDTNSVAYVSGNILASIYTVCKSARLLPSTKETVPFVFEINKWLEHYWDVNSVGYFQFCAGERAALTNLGVTQVGWNPNKKDPENLTGMGTPVFKNIDPMQFVRDPFSDSLANAGYCYTWASYHESVFLKDSRYAEAFKAYKAAKGGAAVLALPDRFGDGPNATLAQSQKQNYTLVIFWVRDGEKIHEIHTINAEHVLYVIEDLRPAMFPFALLYCNNPAGDLIGTSEPAKIFSNSVAVNVMNSLLLTAEYKNQNPPKFISSSSGLNIGAFAEHGHEADKTFVVSGDATRAVHYHQFPLPSQMTPAIVARLVADISQISGIDGRYTGRDTGSILTTGGMEAMLDQATLIDAPKIMNYEAYTKDLTRLLLANMLEFSPQRKYLIMDQGQTQVKEVMIDFPKVPKDILSAFAISISSELPKNKQRIAAAANLIMEKQMQYAASGQKVELMTPEEWLACQDLPNREEMQERMGIQRSSSYMEQVAEILTTFAQLTQEGHSPEEALQLTAAQMEAQNTPGGELNIPMVAQEAPPIPQNMGAPMETPPTI